MRNERKAVVFVQRKNKFAVTRALELVIQFLNHFGTKSHVLVDLTIHHSMNGIVLIMKWLSARRAQIVDLQTNVPESCMVYGQSVMFMRIGMWRDGRGPTRPSWLIQCPCESGPRCLICSKLLINRSDVSALSLAACRLACRSRATMTLIPHMVVLR